VCARRPSYIRLAADAQQTRLRFHRHIADFIEEERTAFRLFEAARIARVCSGERAFLMSE
jgi:hypothetical protein